MREFQFLCGCRQSTHDLKGIVKFIKLFDPILGNPDWTEGEGPVTLAYLRRQLKTSQAITKGIVHPERVGEFVSLGKFSSNLAASFRLFIREVTFSDGDLFSIHFTDQDGLPDVQTLLKAVKITNPAHAELTQRANCDALQTGERYRFLRKTCKRFTDMVNRIWMVHWFQFIDRKTVVTMGGLRHVMKTPCFRIEKFEGGVFWQLTEEHFEPDNPQHLAAQRAAMEHLGIWEFTPEPPFRLALPKKFRRPKS